MRLEVLEYLKKYIQKKYPMYYDSNNQKDFLSFVNIIGSDKKIKQKIENKSEDISLKELFESGVVDSLIDELVSMYAQIKFTKIWANIDSLSSRIKNVIIKESQKNPQIEMVSDANLDIICHEIALGIIKNEESDDYTIYLNGSFNEKFVEDYGYYCQEYKNDVLKRVKILVDKKMERIKFKVTSDTYSSILHVISNIMVRDFKYNDIKNGDCDIYIIRTFNFLRHKIVEGISSYVSTFINNEVYTLLGVSMPAVINDVLYITIRQGEISVEKLLDGKLNNLILGFVEKNREIIVTDNNALDYINEFIYNYNKNQSKRTLSDFELIKISGLIYEKLKGEQISNEQIVNSDYDTKIRELFDSELRKMMSVKQNKPSDKQKVSFIRKLFSNRIFILTLVATLVISAGKLAFDGVKHIFGKAKQVYDDMNSVKPLNKVKEFDGYDYTFIFTRHNDSYNEMVLNIADFYKKASVYKKEEYSYLGFYRFYDKVMDDKLAIMDHALEKLQVYSSEREDLREFYNSIVHYTCYLDFAVDRLEKMGCEEIKDERYKEAVRVYKNAMLSVSGNETPMDILSVNFSKYAKIVEEIMELYSQYSKQCEVDFGNELIDSEKNINLNGNGRAI